MSLYPIKSSLCSDLITVADAYAYARKLSRSHISTVVLSGGRVLDRIAAGESDITTANFERAVRWFDANWPEDVPWPEGLARPSLLAAASNTEAA